MTFPSLFASHPHSDSRDRLPLRRLPRVSPRLFGSRRLGIRLLAASLVLLGLGAPAAHAQDDAQDVADAPTTDAEAAASEALGDETFGEVLQVNIVNLEVYVRDKDGNPVHGLGPEDFRVYEDGDPMEITNFYAVEDGRPVRSIGDDAPADEAAAEGTARPGIDLPRLPEDQQLHLIIYVDNFNLRPASRNRTLARLRGFLRSKIRPGDRMMVVSHDRTLHLRQAFTSDMDLISDALDELEGLSGHLVDRDAQRRQVLEQIEEVDDALLAMNRVRSYADSVSNEFGFSIRALQEQIRLLSGLPGRKALLYVSDGLPSVVGEDLFLAVEEFYRDARGARLEAMVYDLSPQYRQMVSQANAAGVTFYALDAGGLQTHSSVSADYGGTARGGGLAYIDTIRSANMNEPLYRLSDDTGGVAVVGTNAIAANLEQMVDDFRNYYSIGYAASHFGDGRYYDLDVEVLRDDVKVRHRQGYRDRTPIAQITDGLQATVHYGSEANPLGLEVGFEPPQRDDEGHFVLPMNVKIPIGNLTLVPRGDLFLATVRLGVVVRDDTGVSPVQMQEPLHLRIPAGELEDALGKHFTYSLSLAMRPGLSRIALSARDAFSSKTSFVRQTVNLER